MVLCLEQGADLHMAQLMPLPLTVSCFSKIQIGFTFLVPAHPGRPTKGPLNGCVCVCTLSFQYIYVCVHITYSRHDITSIMTSSRLSPSQNASDVKVHVTVSTNVE